MKPSYCLAARDVSRILLRDKQKNALSLSISEKETIV